jgi:REP element-mobilizing transposase RayT
MADKPHAVTEALLIRRGQLPHWQAGGSIYFITFRSARGPLPEAARRQVKENILFDHGKRYDLVLAVVMPDHVHLLLCPRPKSPGVWHDLSEIMKGIKGVSSRRINQLLGTAGQVWQQESYDRIIRDENELEEKMQYIWENPIKAGLTECPEQYEFIVLPSG